MTNNTKTPYTTLFNSFKRHIKTLTASLEEKDFRSFKSLFKSLDAFKSHQAENRKLNQLLFSQVRAYLNYVNDISTWFTNDDALSTLIQPTNSNASDASDTSNVSNASNASTSGSYVSEAYSVFMKSGVTPLYSKPLISEYLYHVSINSGLPFADETILNSSEQISERIRKDVKDDVNDEVDKFVDCEFSVLIANLVLFLDFAAMYTGKKGNKSNKSAVSNKETINAADAAEIADAKDSKDTNDTKDNVFELDGANAAEVAGYQDAINWLNSFIETKAGLAKLRAKVWETLTSGHTVDFLD